MTEAYDTSELLVLLLITVDDEEGVAVAVEGATAELLGVALDEGVLVPLCIEGD